MTSDEEIATVIFHELLHAIALIGIHSDHTFELLLARIASPSTGGSPRLRAAIVELIHAAREED
jgi:predicted aminopeptidase